MLEPNPMASQQYLAADTELLKQQVKNRPYTILGTLVGVILLILAAYVPLLRYNPANPPTWIYIFPYATSWGFETLDLLFLVPAAVPVVILAIRGPNRLWAWTATIAGIWAVLLQGLLFLHQYIFNDLWLIPSVGWGLAVLSGLILTLLGGYTLIERRY